MRVLALLSLLSTAFGQNWLTHGHWRLLSPSNQPALLADSQAAVVGGQIYLTVPTQDGTKLFQFDADTASFVVTTPPLPPISDVYVGSDLEAIDGTLVSFGGRSAGYANTGYLIAPSQDHAAWRTLSFTDAPSARNGHTICLVGSQLLLFGGWDSDRYFDDLFFIDVTMLSGTAPVPWHSLNPVHKPTPRNSHSVVAWGGNMVLFGGFSHIIRNGTVHCNSAEDGCSWYNDVWFYSTLTSQWLEQTITGDKPSPRSEHTANVIGDFMYVHGGQQQTGPLSWGIASDTWALNLRTLKWSVLVPAGDEPRPRRHHSSAVVGNHLFIFGGSTLDQVELTSSMMLYPPEQGDAFNLTPRPGTSVEAGGLEAAVAFNIIFTIGIGFFLFWLHRKRSSGGVIAASEYANI